MPGWHAKTLELQRAGKIQMLGIIEEQHPDRARLFMQWKRMDWPVLVDSFNLLEMTVVPMTVAIDEHGIVRHKGLRLSAADRLDEIFVSKRYDPPAGSAPARSIGAAGTLQSYRKAVAEDPDDGYAWFRFGVAHRLRYDSPAGKTQDFIDSIDAWTRALELDPNNYIWRRRIQQYGPRLGKPYPFYDWVDTARAEIGARGEVPHPLTVEPGGAEIASPQRRFAAAGEGEEPDPEGRIHRDPGKLIRVSHTVVPQALAAAGAVRVHLDFHPDPTHDAHWNNEVDGLRVWIVPPPGLDVDRRSVSLPNPPATVSEETRRVEFEVHAADLGEASPPIRGYALYYVCEGVTGLCQYRRQDLLIPIPLQR